MADILIDRGSLQAQQHLLDQAAGQTPERLTTFLELLGEFGEVAFSQHSGLRAEDLGACRLLVITTRPPEGFGHFSAPFSNGEIVAIHEFVLGGGSLLLMSNHGPDRRFLLDATEEDSRLARDFGVCLEKTRFAIPQSLTLISEASQSPHPMLCDESGERVVNAVCINNCSSISPTSLGDPVLALNPSMVYMGPRDLDHPSADGRSFGVAVDAQGDSGRVLVLTDSGFIGTEGSRVPGPGLIEQGDNRLFVSRAVHWLLGCCPESNETESQQADH